MPRNIFTKMGFPQGVRLVPENCANLIDRLIEQRHKRGMTQKELAQAACLTQSVIARMERKKATPQLDTLLKVAAALGCELEIVPAGR